MCILVSRHLIRIFWGAIVRYLQYLDTKAKTQGKR